LNSALNFNFYFIQLQILHNKKASKINNFDYFGGNPANLNTQKMKRSLFYLVFILCYFISLPLYSQVIPPESIRSGRKGSVTTSPSPKSTKNKAPRTGGVKNVVTLNLTSLGFSNLSLRYERRLKGKLSVGIGGGYLLSGLLPNVVPVDGIIGGNEFGVQTATGSFSGFNATPELRFYPFSKRGAPYGFYLSLFGRYFNYSWDVPYVSVPDPNTGETLSANARIGLTGMGGGTTLGAQFLIKDFIVIDWFFIGGGVAPATISGEVSSPDITDDLAYYENVGQDLETFYGDLPGISGTNLEVDVEPGKASVSVGNQLWPIIRVGIAIGVAF